MSGSSGLEVSVTTKTQETDRTILLAAKGGGIVFIGSVFGYVSQLVLGIILTRFLGAELYGQYKIAIIAGEIAANIAVLGLDYAMVKFVALYASRHDPEGIKGTLQVGIGLTLISSLVIGIALFALATPLSLHVFHDLMLVPLLRLSSLIVPFSTLSNVLASATRGFNKMQYNVGAKLIAQPITRIVLILPFILLGLTVNTAIIPYIGALIISFVLLAYFLNKLFPLNRPSQSSRRDLKGVMRFSLPVYFATLVYTFGPSLQTVLLGSLNTMANAGIFSAANQVSTASTLFNQSIGTAADPILSEFQGRDSRVPMAHFYKITAKWMLTVNLPMFLIVLLLAEPILSIFGSEFIAGSKSLIVLAISNLVIAAAGVSDGLLTMTGRTTIKLVNTIFQTAGTIAFCYFFIPRWGVYGAAVAALVTSAIFHLLLIAEVFVLYKMLPYTKSFLKPIAAGLVALVIGWEFRGLLHTNTNIFLTILNAIVIFLVYAGMVLMLGLSDEDRVIFEQLKVRIGAKFLRREQ